MSDDLLDLIRNVRFTPVRVREGYDMGQVDYFLDRLESAVSKGEDLGPILDGAEFSEVRLREGYDIAEVDAFLADLRSAPARSAPAVEPAAIPADAVPAEAPPVLPLRPDLAVRIRKARFTPVRLREGYDMGEVDRFLDRLEKAVETGTDTAPAVAAARFTPVRLREGYDMRDVDDFLEEIVAEQRRPAPPIADPGVIVEQRGLLSRLFGKH